MDEQIMHLVSLIAGQVCSRGDLFRNEGRIVQALINEGCLPHDADAALTMMQQLARRSDDRGTGDAAAALRVMSPAERGRFSVEAFGLVVKLSHLGVLDMEQREDLIERALVLHEGRIGTADIRSLLAEDLLAGTQELGELFDASRTRSATTTWN